MTGNTNKTRAVILAALMVFSVFAGTVAFSGNAAAQEYVGGAVQYNNATGGSGSWIIEVPLDGSVPGADTGNVTLLDDGDPVPGGTVNNIRLANSDSTVILNLSDKYASNDLEVEFDDSFNSDLEGEYAVEFAATTLDGNAGGDGGIGGNETVFAGETVAIINASASGGDTVPLEGDDDDNSDYFNTFANGTNSEVFYINTDDLSGDYEYNESGDFLTVRDLGLEVSIDELNVTTEDDIEGTVNAVDSGRDVTVELLDDDGDAVASDNGELSGQGEYDFDISANRDTGEYTIEVTDNDTQIQVESSTITISEEDDDDASFTQNTFSEERGDIVEMTVQMESTDFATISIGEDDGSEGVRANATVEDENGDGEVTVYLNTYRLTDSPSASGDVLAVDSDSDDSVTDLQSGDGLNEGTDDLIDAGNYDLQVMAGEEQYTADSDSVATLTLEERSTETLRMWTGSSEEISPSDLEDVNEAIENGEITQSSEVAVGDFAVHQLVASGFEGALDAREEEEVTGDFLQLNRSGPINLTIEEASPGANQDARELNVNSTDNLTVIADGPNDTYFVIIDTEQVDYKNGDDLPNDDDTALETNFTVLQDDAGFDFTPDSDFDDDENSETFVEFNANEPEVTIDTPYNVSQAEGQTVSGTTNIAPGTELSLRVRSESGVSPSFLKTAAPVVQPDGSFNATFDFSDQNVGDDYDIRVNSQILTDGPSEESGTVVEAVATDTATPEPGDTATPEPTDTATPEPTDTATPEPTDTATATEEPTDTPTSTPTSTPGFGVIVALTALLAAALLAVRRNN